MFVLYRFCETKGLTVVRIGQVILELLLEPFTPSNQKSCLIGTLLFGKSLFAAVIYVEKISIFVIYLSSHLFVTQYLQYPSHSHLNQQNVNQLSLLLIQLLVLLCNQSVALDCLH